MQRILVLTGSGQLLTTEEIGLARLNRCVIAYNHLRRCRSLYLQRHGHGAIAPASELLQGIAPYIAVSGQLLATEQVFLAGLDCSGIGGRFL